MYCLVVQSRFLHIHQFNVSLINLGRRERGGRLEELLAFRQATAIVRERHAHGQSLFLSGGGGGWQAAAAWGRAATFPPASFVSCGAEWVGERKNADCGSERLYYVCAIVSHFMSACIT